MQKHLKFSDSCNSGVWLDFDQQSSGRIIVRMTIDTDKEEIFSLGEKDIELLIAFLKS